MMAILSNCLYDLISILSSEQLIKTRNSYFFSLFQSSLYRGYICECSNWFCGGGKLRDWIDLKWQFNKWQTLATIIATMWHKAKKSKVPFWLFHTCRTGTSSMMVTRRSGFVSATLMTKWFRPSSSMRRSAMKGKRSPTTLPDSWSKSRRRWGSHGLPTAKVPIL